jgi:ActR/RegA family two-component response regulator
MGGEVRHFHKATDALHHFNIEYADYIIVDYMLGGAHNGIQFLNQLRQKLDKPIRAVLVTGDTSATLIREAANSDWPVLYKPVNLDNLIAGLSAQGL